MRRVAALAAFQVLVILGWAGQQEVVRATAETFRLPLQPADPHDVLRGRYFILNPLDGSIWTGSGGSQVLTPAEVARLLGGGKRFAGPAQVGFCPEGELQRVCALAPAHATPPAGPAAFWSRADLAVSWQNQRWESGAWVDDPGWSVEIDLGLERFFLPERLVLPATENAPGWELEVCHRPGLTPLPLRLWFRGRPVWPE